MSVALGVLSPNTRRSVDSGASTVDGTRIGAPNTTLPLSLPPASRTNQWSEVEELVEPAGL